MAVNFELNFLDEQTRPWPRQDTIEKTNILVRGAHRVKKHSEVLVDIKPCLTAGRVRTVHQTRLARYYGPRDTKNAVYPDDADEISDNREEMAELVTTGGVGAEDLTTPDKLPCMNISG